MGRRVALIGTGFVADLYAASLQVHPDITVIGCYDRETARLEQFTSFHGLPKADSAAVLFGGDANGAPDLILNLTNPGEHFEVTKAALQAGLSVYSEKPLAVDFGDCKTLHALARERGLQLASAPCSLLSEAGQAVCKAVREEAMGVPRVTYAEIDDDFIPQAPYKQWQSASGAPWPYDDEFQVGCTLEHAGYYLTWLIGAFGPVERIIAASAEVLPDKEASGPTAPDFSVATLFFRDGMVARLTCSIAAPHDHRLRIVGDKGVLEVEDCWFNTGAVQIRPRFAIRRKLINSPLAQPYGLRGRTHPKVDKRGAAAMNFALGPADVLEALEQGRDARLGGDFALHLNEVTLAIQNAGRDSGPLLMETTCERPAPMPWAVGSILEEGKSG